jgi:hypothetical protein
MGIMEKVEALQHLDDTLARILGFHSPFLSLCD